YTLPPSHGMVEAQVAESNNGVRFFVAQMLERGRIKLDGFTTNETFWKEYRAFSLGELNVRPIPSTELPDVMKELGGVFGFKVEENLKDGGVKTVGYRGLVFVQGKA